KSHNQVFTVSCNITELELQSKGKGSSRKKAEQQAAKKILDKLGT
ncbi:MAG: ribonuclease III, partial [Gammaproteobacteria bacterium]|nr:ribonuclease III [Gammaproteobacteria bacterium]